MAGFSSCMGAGVTSSHPHLPLLRLSPLAPFELSCIGSGVWLENLGLFFDLESVIYLLSFINGKARRVQFMDGVLCLLKNVVRLWRTAFVAYHP
jgi:hypothetical protein